MAKADLQQFARQLAAWTQLVIDNGRTPFRKVTLYTALQTDQGEENPPLIFWINRQSMMAGGLILLPERDLEADLVRGRSCAEALALRHFVTWETDRVRIWQLEKTGVREYREFKIGTATHPDSFRLLLNELLEALKLLAVIGMVPPVEISVHYLLNLFLATLEFSRPPLLDSCRRQRALDSEASMDDPEQLAEEINRLTLLRLLALLWHQQLPSAILPEKLGRAIKQSLPKLPDALQRALARSPAPDQDELPYESCVCFHHLLLRLHQLSWAQAPERALTSIRLQIDNWYPVTESPLAPAPIQFYPEAPVQAETTRQVLSNSAVLLAAQAVLEDLQQQANQHQYFGNLFQFGALPLPAEPIAARLLENRRLSRDERQQYEALLRTSWPNRRFRISGEKPLWFWECLHLLGLCAPHQELQLTLPLEALRSPVTDPFWTLLQENFRIIELHQLAGDQILLKLQRGTGGEQVIQVFSAGRNTRLSPHPGVAALRAQLLLVMALPQELFDLIERDFIYPQEENLGTVPLDGLQLYAGSRLGQLTWHLVSATPAPETAESLLEALADSSWPIPEVELLIELSRQLKISQGSSQPARIDEQLANLLQFPGLGDLSLPTRTMPPRISAVGTTSGKDLKQELLTLLREAGVPVFPEQYLYYLDQPETIRYRLSPPVKKISELLGRFELQDAAGEIIQGYGEEFAEALLLCGELGRSEFDLPLDREQVAMILGYYRQDLVKLQEQLKGLCLSRLKSQSAARKMARNIWRELQLPAEKWFVD